MATKKVKASELIAKKIGPRNVGIFDGETMIGTVDAVLDGGMMQPTGTWSYDCTINGVAYTNWKAGRTWRDAARKLAHKMGYKD